MRVAKVCLGVLATSVLVACGGAGHVGASSADRGSRIDSEGQYNQVVTRARASDFSSVQGVGQNVSTTGFAEVIYGNLWSGQRVNIPNRNGDAEARARAVSGCGAANVDHVQNSIQGTHVIVAMAQCPPIQAGSQSLDGVGSGLMTTLFGQ